MTEPSADVIARIVQVLRDKAREWGIEAESVVHAKDRGPHHMNQLYFDDGRVTTLRQCERELLSIVEDALASSGAPPQNHGPFFQRDLARLVGLPDDASMDDIHAEVQKLASGAPPQKEQEEETRVDHSQYPRNPLATAASNELGPADVQLLAWAVVNCHVLARRALARTTSTFDREKWEHVLRICEKAGARSQGVLRVSVPTEITDGGPRK